MFPLNEKLVWSPY